MPRILNDPNFVLISRICCTSRHVFNYFLYRFYLPVYNLELHMGTATARCYLPLSPRVPRKLHVRQSLTHLEDRKATLKYETGESEMYCLRGSKTEQRW